MVSFVFKTFFISTFIFLIALVVLYSKYENSDPTISELMYTMMNREEPDSNNDFAYLIFLVPLINIVISTAVLLIVSSSEVCEKFIDIIKRH